MKHIFILLLFSCFYHNSFSQDTIFITHQDTIKKTGTFNIIKNDFNSGINDVFSTIKRPLEFEGSDWLKLGIIAGATGLAITQDEGIRNAVKTHHSQSMDNFTEIGKYYGGPEGMLIIPGGIYLSGLIFDSESFRTTGRLLVENLLVSGVLVQILKVSFGRSRPYTNRGAHFFYPFNFRNDDNSFPSGHSIVAFSISSVLAERIDNIYASIGLYGLASLTAYQRIYSDNHWFSDTFLSAAIGICVGKYLVKLNENESGKKNNLSLMPVVLPDFSGLSLRYQF